MLTPLAARRVLGPLAEGVASGPAIVTEDVVWTAVVGCAVDSPNTLRKTAAGGWGNAGAVSTRAILSGAGYVEFTGALAGYIRMAGLSKGDTDQRYQDIDFAWYLRSGTSLEVYEGGVFKGAFGAYVAADVLRVAVDAAGVVTYLLNGVVKYTSLTTAAWPLLLDTAISTIDGTFTGAKINGALVASGY
jgi:hypothetical protein